MKATVDPVILVHRTFATPCPGQLQWYERGSDFCKALDAALLARDVTARCWPTLEQEAAGFSWNGENDWLSRREAAQSLHNAIRSFNGHCHIVAHSHGGNVALEALQIDPGSFHGSLTLLGTPLIIRDVRSPRLASLVYTVLGTTMAVGILRQAIESTAALLWAMVAGVSFYGLARLSRSLDWDFGFGGGNVLSPLYINSEHDEAYRLLSGIVRGHDPFTPQASPSVGVRARVVAVISRLWKEVAASQPPFSLAQAAGVTLLVAAAGSTAIATAFSARGARSPVYVAACALSILVMVLIVKRRSDKTDDVNVTAVLNTVLSFSLQLLKYPATQVGLRVARRRAWPLLKAAALGLSGAPGSIDAVKVAMFPPERQWSFFEFKELPNDLIARVSQDRQDSAQRTVENALDRIWRADWTPEAVREALSQLNSPDLIHSCYYQYLDHGWVVAEIAENIAYTEYVAREDISALNRQTDRQMALNR